MGQYLREIIVQHVCYHGKGELPQKSANDPMIISQFPSIGVADETSDQMLLDLVLIFCVESYTIGLCKQECRCCGMMGAKGAQPIERLAQVVRHAIRAPRHEAKRRSLFFIGRNESGDIKQVFNFMRPILELDSIEVSIIVTGLAQ